MKHELDRTAVHLVLFQQVMELQPDEVIDAFMRVTGKPLKKGKRKGVESYHAGMSLADLIEDPNDLIFWLDYLRKVCQHRLTSAAAH